MERNNKKKKEKEKYSLNLRQIQKRDLLANRYRNRVLDFMEKMAKKPKVVNQPTREIPESSYTNIDTNKKKHKRTFTSVDYTDFITEPGDCNAFNLRPREKSKEIAGDFNTNFSRKNSLQRVYDQAKENSMKANFENFSEVNSKKLRSGRDILPELHDKTHFKGATTLITYDKEIQDIKENPRLRSRFESLKKSVSGSPSYKMHARSIDMRRDKMNSLNFYENNSSITIEAKPSSVMKKVGFNSKDQESTNSRSQLKDLNINISKSDISDYGLQRGGVTSSNTIQRANLPLSKASLHHKVFKKHPSEIFNRERQPSRVSKVSVSRKLLDSSLEENDTNDGLDIPSITKHVLAQCGIVRCLP
ncbi:unnamed protein product [Moneuplotes crassus]|uniref:Uncharacterized protein n=2 Tax=Euplotes crassus TaxID=5936 RepID=A0AAD1UMS3_EUPCR|nr:unnamed protein product [Moneuplotes crassus]